MANKELDVRTLSPHERSRIIYKNLDVLKEGESLRIIFNHNPSPIIGLISRERRGFYSQQFIEEGPAIWRIDFTRKSLDYTISELIHLNPSCIGVFEKYDIPYYYMGEKKISEFLRNRMISFDDFVSESLKFSNPLFEIFKPWEWSVQLLIHFILENHHSSLLKRMNELRNLIATLEKNHGASFPLLQMLKSRFEDFINEQKEHLMEEEQTMFPLILDIINKRSPAEEDLKSLAETMNWMMEDHHTTIEGLHAHRKICNNYIPPDDSIPGLLRLFDDLKTFEQDYHFHLLLENHYLPQSLKRHFGKE
jgi:regulator of cell morphogenesis and NO signaling